jgi:hypothetical protein
VEGSDTVWYYVQLTDGDVHRVTLDQLDDGFQAGHIDASTMVLADGSTRWTRLGQLAGIDDDAEPVRADPVRPLPSPGVRTSPPPRTSAPPRSYAAQPPPPGFAAPFVSARPAPYVPVLHSHRPVSIDLSDLDVGVARRSGSGKGWLAAFVGLAMVSGLGAVALRRPGWAQPYLNRVGLHAASTAFSAAAAVSPPTIVPPPPVAAAPPPAPDPAPTTLPATAPTAETASARAGDSTHADRPQRGAKSKVRKARAPAGASLGAPRPKKGRSAPFSTGGSKYDPLNSSI